MHLVWVQNVKYFNAGYNVLRGFPGGSVVKNLLAKAGDSGSVSGLGRSHGEGNGNPLQYSCLENPMDRGAWWATVHGVSKRQTRLYNQHSAIKSCVVVFQYN